MHTYLHIVYTYDITADARTRGRFLRALLRRPGFRPLPASAESSEPGRACDRGHPRHRRGTNNIYH